VTIAVVRYAEVPDVPWKNGGGATRQLAIQPCDSHDDFEWRVSIATMRGTSQFSRFEGIERQLALLQGEVVLSMQKQTLRLTADSAPIKFDGSAPVESSVERGAAVDLNLMYRSARWRGRLCRHVWPSTLRVEHGSTTMLCALDAMSVVIGDQRVTLTRFDLIRIAAQNSVQASSSDAGEVYVIELQEAAG
jgi:uncharacterized protein